MNILKFFFISIFMVLLGNINAQATVVDVFARANSSTGGSGAVTGVNVAIGDRLVMVTDPNDCWSAGAPPRDSNANGLTAGNPCPNGGIFPDWTQAGVSAPFGSLMGKIGAGNFFFVGTDFDQVMAEAGALLLYYWDSNAGDNTEFVSVDISLNPDLPAPGALGLIGLGLGFLLYRRRKS